MKRDGPIVIIDDDPDEHDILSYAYRHLDFPNELIFFSNGFEALEYLRQPHVLPFMVVSDVNMPVMDGFALRKIVFESEDLRDKCIPYLFLTNGSNPSDLTKAYRLSVQGFFQKERDITQTEITLRQIIEYWQKCLSPDLP